MSINLGIIGYGNIAKTHLASVLSSEVKAYAVLTHQPRPELAEIFTVVYTDLDAFLADEAIDIVDICTPNFKHYPEGIASFAANKAVYMEKPIGLNDGEALKLLEASKGHVNAVALNNRFNPFVIKARDLVAAGSIGVVTHFRCAYYHWSYISMDKLSTWRQVNEFSGGGAITDLGIHAVDMIRFVLGEISSVQASSRTLFTERYTDSSHTTTVVNDTDEYTAAILTLKDGTLGMLDTSRISKPLSPVPTLEIYGTLGTIEIYGDHIAALDLAGNSLDCAASDFYHYVSVQLRQELSSEIVGFNALHGLSYRNFIHMYQGDKVYPEVPDFQQAYDSQRVISAIQAAARSNKTIRID